MIMRDVEEDGKEQNFEPIKVHGNEVKELRYADDTVLMSKYEEKEESKFRICSLCFSRAKPGTWLLYNKQ